MVTNTIQGLNELIKNRLIEKKGNVKLTENKDIKIIYTGLRPGEKLYEELLSSDENSLPTHHKQILIGKVRAYQFDDINSFINELILLFNTQNNALIVSKMKDIVPEFVSNNSVFQSLD